MHAIRCATRQLTSLHLIAGFFAGSHFSPCNPRNLDRCGRRLSSTLLGLEAASGSGAGGALLPAPQEEATALCP